MNDRTAPIRIPKTSSYSSPKFRRERGIALFTTLLLLSLISLLGLAMVLSVNSDMLINGYYGNYRSSFYAADSGLNIARQTLANQLQANVNMTPCAAWGATAPTGCTSDPLNGFNAATVLSSLKTTYSSFTATNSSGSWPGSFIITDSTSGYKCSNGFQEVGTPVGHPLTGSPGLYDSYTYNFTYTLCAIGRAQSLQQAMVQENGSISLTVQAESSGSTPVPTSFSAFGAFIDNFSACSAPLVPGTITGPTFTNGAWNWGTSGSYTYTDPVGQAGSKASYWFGSSCQQVSANSDTYKGQTIKPTFQQGFNLGAQPVALPSNDFSQKWAVLDGIGCGEGGSTCGATTPPNPTNANLNSVLKDVTKTSYPSSGTTKGVFLPYCTGGASCTNPYTVSGGGIYVEGNANVTLSIGNDTSGNPTQIYTITQGSTTTTITTNIAANTTTMVSGGNSVTLTGVPENLAGGPPQPSTMLYVDGTITSLTGPGQGKAGIQDGAQITVAANGSIDITGDLIYAHEPVTLNTSDTLVANTYDSSGKQLTGDFNSVLGIFTANGDIVLTSPYSNNNLETDASLAALNSSCTSSSSSSICGFATGSGGVNTWTIVGGRIESNAHSVSINQGNTYFDRRFTTKAGFAPPWFPATTVPANDLGSASAPYPSVTTQRLSWVAYPQ